ncbi:MAG: FapA family protein [Pseudomonadota bacterium]
MTEEKTHKTACPNCNTVYKLPDSFMGKVVSCKRCGAKFKATDGDSRKTYPLVGKLALKYGLITQEQLESALTFQTTTHSLPEQEISLDKILFAKGYITEEQLELLNLSQKYWQVSQLSNGFCTVAINKKMISPADAEAALKSQSAAFTQYRTIRRVSDILVETGKMTPEQKETVLAAQGRLGPTHAGHLKMEGENAVSGTEIPSKRITPAITESEKEKMQARSQAGFAQNGEFELIVSEDRLTAIIRPAGGRGVANSVSYVHELLAAGNITHGILPDPKIIAYMETDALEGKPLTVAHGTPPKPGTNATIRYHMDTGEKSDKTQTVGIIDYRDRGQLPHVNKGELLAEKIPAVPGEPGVDVYGAKLAPPKSLDQNLRNGAGTVLSVDGLRLTAETAGQPKITFGGRVSVLTELKIDGDLDFKTGHVDFDGNIIVTGCVQSGFRVKGHHLTANEIAEADIKVTGDITVAGGIIGATINSQGNIQAKYIKDAKISTYGNITVTKEIADSTIETSGSCIVGGGKIFASTISAKQGIQSKDIGTEMSPPCKLAIGVDAHIEQEIAGIKNAILKREEKRNQLKAKLGMLDVEEQNLHQKITQLAQVQDRSLVEKRSILAGLEKLKTTAPAGAVANAGKKIQELDQKAQSAEAELSVMFETQDQIEKQMQEIELERKHLKEELAELKEGKQSIIEWAKTRKAVAAVTVSGQIHAGTLISGVHTKTHLREMLSHVRIHEVKLTDPDAPVEWEIRLSPIK